MISPVSFSGTFKVSNKVQKSFDFFMDYALLQENKEGVQVKLHDSMNSKSPYNYKAQLSLIVPDSMDADVEMYCLSRGIKFKKYETADLLNIEKIQSRVLDAPEGFKKVYVDTEKLEELAENQESNLEHCRNDYNKYYKQNAEFMLRDGGKISVPELKITPLYNSGTDGLVRYIETYGIENLNKGQIMLSLHRSTDEPDYCLYFALKDLGMKKIPVYADDETYKAGSALGLFS